jgi:hypothetical protein
MWLYMKLVGDERLPQPSEAAWNVGATPSSAQRAHSGS